MHTNAQYAPSLTHHVKGEGSVYTVQAVYTYLPFSRATTILQCLSISSSSRDYFNAVFILGYPYVVNNML